jgi:hypothetical protein
MLSQAERGLRFLGNSRCLPFGCAQDANRILSDAVLAESAVSAVFVVLAFRFWGRKTPSLKKQPQKPQKPRKP